MPIKTTCPACLRADTVADEREGSKVRCKGCGATFPVPTANRPQDESVPSGLKETPQVTRKKKGGGAALWLAVGGGALVLLVVVPLVLWLADVFGTNRVTAANFEKLRVGMTEAELVAVLGPPAEVIDDLRDQIGKVVPLPVELDALGPRVRTLRWKDRGNTISVTLVGERAQSGEGSFDHGRARLTLGKR
jgi:hypothetical protein